MPDIFLGELDLDLTPPYVQNEDPAPGQTNVSIETAISFNILEPNFEAGVDPDTITVTVNGTNAILDGFFQTGYNGSISPITLGLAVGYRVIIVPAIYLSDDSTFLITVDADDLAGIPNTMPTHSWTFYTGEQFDTNAHIFLANSMTQTVNSASSAFQSKFNQVQAGSHGNISLSVEKDNPDPTKNYQIRTIVAGRLDTKLNVVQNTELELGVGQITYEDEKVFKGDYQPPLVVVDDGDEVYGINRTFNRMVYSSINNPIFNLRLVDRDDDTFFVFYRDGIGVKASAVNKVNTSGSTGITALLVSGASGMDAAVKLSFTSFMVASLSSSSAGGVRTYTMEIVKCDQYVVNEEVISPFQFTGPDASDAGHLDLIADGSGNVYGTFYYTETGNDIDRKIRFIRSYDNGNNWDFVYFPGTNEISTLPNFFDEIGFDPYTTNGDGLEYPRLSYDPINEIFIITVMSKRTAPDAGARCGTAYSKDFVTWNRLNYPVFRNFVQLWSTAEDLDTDEKSAKLVRFNNKYFSICSDSEGIYSCIFESENETHGSRRGLVWAGDNSSATGGYRIDKHDYAVFNNVLYYATEFLSTGFAKIGFVIHALGGHTNLPDKTQYSGGWFGTVGEPDSDIGFSKTVGGTSSASSDQYGLTITVNTGAADQLYYGRTDLDTSVMKDDGAKVKFVIKPVQDGGRTSDSAQRIHLKLPNTGNTDNFHITVRVSTDGIYVVNESPGGESAQFAITINDFYEILLVAKPSSTTCVVKCFYRSVYANALWTPASIESTTDTWIELTGIPTFTSPDTTSKGEFHFGLIGPQPSQTSEAIWKSVYYCDGVEPTDIEFTTTDSIDTYNPSTDEASLDLLPIGREGIRQRTVGSVDTWQRTISGIILRWHGLDAFKNDSWTFNTTSDFNEVNVTSKIPKLVYRTENTSSDQSVLFFSEDDDMGAYIMDTFIMLNTNFRYCKIQANNDGTTWSPAPLELDVDFGLEDGTIYETTLRINEDMLTIRCVDKEWLHGELRGKYILLERIFEPHVVAPPGSDQEYRNVAFKIVDNGADFVIISTAGLIDDAAHGGASSHLFQDQRVVAGDSFVIYDSRMSLVTRDVSAYKYVRFFIRQSDLWSDPWGNNQPSLPNEDSWSVGELDFGKRIELEDNFSYGSTRQLQQNNTIKENDYGQSDVTNQGEPIHVFSMVYNITSDDDADALQALYDAANEVGQPFWYIPDVVTSPEELYLVVFSKDYSYSKTLPDRQDIKFLLEEVV